MSATDELRRLLDERGVPYETNDDMGASETRWNGFTAYQLTPNAKLVMHPTPEQAIAATLGGGECENLIDPWSVHDSSEPDFECSVCHASGHANGNIDGGEYLFCPRCGEAVKR